MTDRDGRFLAEDDALVAPLKGQDTAELLELLSDADEATRYAAAMVLQGRGDAEVFERAVDLAASEPSERRETAAFLLGQLGFRNGYPFRDRSVPLLMGLLAADPSPQVRASAAAALGHLDATCALEALVAAADDADPRVRLSVAATLGRLALPACVPVLQRMCGDADEDVAEWARTGIEMLLGRQLDGASAGELLDIFVDPAREPVLRQVAADIFAQRDGETAREHGFRLAGDADAALRCSAVYLLAAVASWHHGLRGEVIPPLADMLRHDATAAVRQAAAEGLAQLGETVVRATLAKAATGSAPRLRSAAGWALKRIASGDMRTTTLFERLFGRARGATPRAAAQRQADPAR